MESELVNANWNEIIIDEKNFCFKSFFGEDSLDILIVDLDHFNLYILKQNSNEIETLFQELNPRLEAPISTVLLHLERILFDNSSNSLKLNEQIIENNTLSIQLQTIIHGIKFHYKFDMKKIKNELIKDYLVKPLLFSNYEHQLRENELMKIIQHKDKELEDYKSQGFKLSRNYLKTDIFKIESFSDIMKKKTEFNKDLIMNPYITLHTSLAHTIHKDCMIKYMKESTQNLVSPPKSEKKKIIDDSFRIKSSDGDNKEDETSPEKDRDRLLELEVKLKREKEDKNRTPKKKKKLFK